MSLPTCAAASIECMHRCNPGCRLPGAGCRACGQAGAQLFWEWGLGLGEVGGWGAAAPTVGPSAGFTRHTRCRCPRSPVAPRRRGACSKHPRPQRRVLSAVVSLGRCVDRGVIAVPRGPPRPRDAIPAHPAPRAKPNRRSPGPRRATMADRLSRARHRRVAGGADAAEAPLIRDSVWRDTVHRRGPSRPRGMWGRQHAAAAWRPGACNESRWGPEERAVATPVLGSAPPGHHARRNGEGIDGCGGGEIPWVCFSAALLARCAQYGAHNSLHIASQ